MGSDLKDTKILLVDNPSEVRNMREVLRDLGFNNVSEMSDGLQVITAIKKDPPDIIMVNYNLPKYSGLQVFNSMSKDKALARIKFIMLSPKMNRRELEDMEKQGIQRILQRPFEEEQLKEMIYSVLGFDLADLKLTAEEFYKEGQELFQADNYEEAVTKFRDALDSAEDANYYMLGRCYLEMDMVDQALAAFQNTVKLDPKHPEIDHWMGVALQRKKEYKESVKSLERAAKRKNANANTQVELGKSHLGTDQEPEAGAAFNKAKEMEPKNADVHKDIGNAYLENGKYEKAEEAFNEALDISPDNLTLYNRQAIALRQQGKHKEAINLYIKAIKIAPKDEGLYYNLSRALFEDGQAEKAVKAINKALTLDPEFEEAKTLKGCFLEYLETKKKDGEEAKKEKQVEKPVKP
jgi:tetratricopeptide (TPR) repeat protein